MKKQTGIWIDSSKAIIVNLNEGNEEVLEIESGVENRIHHDREGDKGSFMGGQHISHEKKFEERKNQQLESFMKDVLTRVKGTDELFIFGPAEMKIRMKQKISEEKSFPIEKLKSVEAADSMTLNQVVARVKKFFKS